MPQRFGDAEFTGNVRVRGKLTVDRGSDTNGSHSEAIARINKRLDEMSVEGCVTGGQENSVMAIAKLRDDLDAQQAALNIVQQEVGSVAASVHKSQHSDTSTIEQMRTLISQLVDGQKRVDTQLQDVMNSSSVDTDMELLRDECKALRSTVGELRYEIDRMTEEKDTVGGGGGSDDDVMRLSQTVNELFAHVKHKGCDNRRSNAQISDMTERMIQSAIADLRTEFACVQREGTFNSVLSKQYESTRDECAELRENVADLKNRLISVETQLVTFKDETAKDSERMELQRRQVATIVAELDRVKSICMRH